jgi:curli biogenesis system outer membrane secretion channel CsgG
MNQAEKTHVRGLAVKCTLFLAFLVLAACEGMPDSSAVLEPVPPIIHEDREPAQQLNLETGENDTLIECINKSAVALTANIPQGTIMAVIQITSQDAFEAEFAEEQLIFVLVLNGKYRIVERKDLDLIRGEQNFHLSGEVDDNTAVSIGKMAGAGIVITGTILPYGTGRYLNLRALDVETAQIRAASSRSFSSF